MKEPPHEGRRRFELPPDAERYLLWYGFIKRLPTTIFWLSLVYVAGFTLLTLILWIGEIDPTGVWLGLYYLGGMIFVAALFLFFAGWQRRRME